MIYLAVCQCLLKDAVLLYLYRMDGSDFRNMTEYVKHKLLTEHQTMEQVSSDLQLLFPCQKGFR